MKYDEVAAHPFLLTAHVAAERVSKFWVGGPRCTPRPGAGARCRRARGHVNTAAHPPASPAGLWPAESAQRLSLSKFCVSRIACDTRTFFLAVSPQRSSRRSSRLRRHLRPSRRDRRDRRASLACVDGPPATDAFSQPMYAHSVLSPAHAGFATMRSSTLQTCCAVKRGTRDDGPPFPAS